MLASRGRGLPSAARCAAGKLETDAAGDDRAALPGQAPAVAEVFQPGNRPPAEFPPRCLLAPAVTGWIHKDQVDAASGQLPECLFQPGAKILAVGEQEDTAG
jgi:hypothetical protein